jgi:hypothetical protein
MTKDLRENGCYHSFLGALEILTPRKFLTIVRRSDIKIKALT